MAFHPHIHSLNLSGVILPDGSFHSIEANQQRLQDLFADKVLSALLFEQLLSQDDIDNMKSWNHSGFNVFIGDPIQYDDQKRLLFAARYLKKCPLSNQRLTIVEPTGDDSYIQYASFKDNDNKSIRTFTPLQFLAEASQHIPDIWEQTVRYLGKYSARTRGANKEKKITVSDNPSPLPEQIHKPSASWARLINPLSHKATAGQEAFITDYNQISRITENLGIQNQRAPPKLKYSLPLAA